MEEKKYWQSFGELNQSEAFEKSVPDEFRQPLASEALEEESLFNAKTPRRDFLKYVGFSTAAATLAASCEMPVRYAVPFLNKRDDILPGVANYYASTYVNEGDAIPVLVKQREGRPIKIEGNTLSPLTKGGTSAQLQASILDLYDTSRLRYPIANGKEVTFEIADKMITEALGSLGGKPIVLLTSSIHSPSALQIIKEFTAKFPGSRHVQYDAVSYSGMIQANKASYGKQAIPSYHFDKAKIIVSIAADFLGTWLTPVVFNRQYAETRKINASKPEMSKHFQFESHLSLTGANADERFIHKPSETGQVALALLAAVGGNVVSTLQGPVLEAVKKVAVELLANKGAGLVVCGSNDTNIQLVVNAINEAIGSAGKTIDWGSTVNTRQGVDEDMSTLTNDLQTGNVGALLVYGANPVYSSYAADKFIDGLKKCQLTISFSEKMDETTELCKYSLPADHWLESWGDAEPQAGFVSLIQPVIHPLFKTRPFSASLLKWSGNTIEYNEYFKKFWIAKIGSEDKFNQALQDGIVGQLSASGKPVTVGQSLNTVIADTLNVVSSTMSSLSFSGNVADASSKIGLIKGSEVELVMYQKVSLGTGSQANNPWLQELPDPITRATWDNYLIISPALGKSMFGIDITNRRDMDAYEVHPEKPMVKITCNGKSKELPILIVPGIHQKVVALALGYGRQSNNADKTSEYIGKAAAGVGVNAYPFSTFNGSTVEYSSPVTIEKSSNTYRIAQTQTHSSAEGRPIFRETTLKEFIAEPKKIMEEENKELGEFGKDYAKDATIYPYYEKPGIKWGMSIDLNTCTGCTACVVACHAENNVPVVGKNEVARFHEMHWLRIDRYFSGDVNNPEVVFQPMLCQHCDNAPCENVCPVSATNHSSEGLNQMAYNRCIGTRYCANNCPYKVRRFNWADYTGADSFPDNQKGIISDATMMMNDDLMRMVLNPDVVVRSRGVMEKCSFCVQRLQEGKLTAKKEDRVLNDGDVQTACMQACPTNAIIFGNVNDTKSKVFKIRNEEQKDRTFYVLEQLHVLSNVNYLAKVRNKEVLATEVVTG